MNIFEIAAILLTLSALFSYINFRWIKLPSAIGLMLISLSFSLILVLLDNFGIFLIRDDAMAFISSIDFNKTLMDGMLSFLLFAGALHVNINDLLEKKWEIMIFSTFGVIASTLLVSLFVYGISDLLGFGIPFIYCLIFGALISPTDPIAVLGILKQSGAPKGIQTKIIGESLFNDGIGIVVFITLLGIAGQGSEGVDIAGVAVLFIQETLGGIILGFLLGWVVYKLIKTIDNYQVEILLTLALVTGGYALALALHTSGPIAVVIAGLLIGNQGRILGMSSTTRDHLDSFWELIDEILNAVLFVLIGLEILVIKLTGINLVAGLLTIPAVLAARFLVIGLPVKLLMVLSRTFSPNAIKVMTWGGLRGGISVALALSLPLEYSREVLLTMTYCVVAFSILIQGTTVKYLVADPES